MTQNQLLKRCILVLALLSLSFIAVNTLETQKSFQHSQAVIKKRVAIIGAGAGGSSAAFWLSKAFPSTGDISVNTTIFEAANYVGGRSTIIPIKDDPELGVVELGASVFVDVNWNMMNATKRFGLELKDLGSVKSTIGVWNGQKFIFQETGNSWWDMAKALIRFGVAPFRVRNLVLSTIDRLSYAYSHDISPAFTNIKNFTNFLNFGEETGRTARRYLITDSRIDAKYIEQIVQSATRINYAQNIDTIHALGALVSMAAQGAKSVKGGNFQIFQKFIEEAGAELRLETKVAGIKKVVDKTGEKVYEVESKGGKKELFDTIILAAPIHQTNINFNNIPSSAAADLIANPPTFQTVHVTFIAGIRDPKYFGFDDLSKVPNLVITTADGSLFPEHRQPFTTFAEHHLHNETGESIVKMFSAAEVPDALLDALFTTRSWTRRHVWQAYPVLTPVSDIEHEKMAEEDQKRFSEENKLSMSNIRDKATEFLRSWGVLPQKQAEIVKPVEEKKMDSLESRWPPVVLDEEHEGEGDGGVFYVNSFESFISTMETETLASKNVVRLLHKQWCENCEPFGDGWTAVDAAEPVPEKSKDEL